MSLPVWEGGKEKPLLKASKTAVTHQRSCQGKDPGQGPESQSQRACGALLFSELLSGEARCLLHLMYYSGRWQGPIQTVTGSLDISGRQIFSDYKQRNIPRNSHSHSSISGSLKAGTQAAPSPYSPEGGGQSEAASSSGH